MKSDIYTLRLILFEIFTGRHAYDAKTISDLKQRYDTGTIVTPSAIVRDLDPAVERVIMRCLARDPAQRPASALAVAVALPGGDPLAGDAGGGRRQRRAAGRGWCRAYRVARRRDRGVRVDDAVELERGTGDGVLVPDQPARPRAGQPVAAGDADRSGDEG